MTTFATLPLGSIVSSPTNPRKTFNAIKMAELAESIKASGVHQPILVRPLPGSRVGDTDRAVTHEIVSGERRWRASQQAAADTIPAMIRTLTDGQVLEIQLVENLQRDDLTELEEAEGYQALMQASELTADAIALKISKSRSYVFGRLKLLDLSVECKQALREGQIDASRAILIARIPDTALQTKALAEATRKDFNGQVCSVRALQSWLQANVMLRLDRAAFSPADSTLVIGVGNCSSCPKRTGANPDLFSDVQSADICTDPPCFHEKEQAHRNSVLDTAAKRGMRLIDGDEAEDICYQYTSTLTGYSPLTQERKDTADGQPATLGQLLGKDAPAPVLIENPWTKELIAAVPTDEAEAMLLARGLVKAVQDKEAKAKSADTIQADIKTLQAQAEKATNRLFRQMAMKTLADAVHSSDDAMAHKLVCPLLIRAWWLRQAEELDNSDLAQAFDLELVKPEGGSGSAMTDAQTTQVRLHIQACSQAKLYKALVIYMVQEDYPNFFYGGLSNPTLFTALASEMGVDLDEVEAEAKAKVREETADRLKLLKAQLKGHTANPPAAYRGPNGETWTGRGLKPRWLTAYIEAGGDQEALKTAVSEGQKPSLPLASAAQAKGGGVGKKQKTSAAQAQAQIAAALQAQEDTNPGATAQGIDGTVHGQPVAPSAAVASEVALAVDRRVMVTADYQRLPITQHKYSGKEGTITQAMDDNRWMVSFKGRNGGMCAFDSADLAVVEVAA